MDNRKWQAAASATPPADEASPSSGYPTDGNPSTPTPATIPGARWFHQVGEEIRAVIAAAGLTPDSTVLTQLRDAIQAMIVGAQKAVIVNGVTFEASVADGEAVRWDSGNNRFDEAIADGTANNRAVGIADVTNSRVYLYGECPLFSGLTPGARYYLDASTAGAITDTAPTDAVKVGVAKSATILWVDIDHAAAADLQHGQCVLVKSGADLLLKPWNGNKLIIGGVSYTIPSAGVTLAATSLTPGTTYFIYAYMNAGTMTLEASATGHSTDATTGVEIKTGDATRTLVGQARVITGPAWQDTSAQRFVRSWFGGHRIEGGNAFAASRTTTSNTYVELSSSERAEFLIWAHEVLDVATSGMMQNSYTGLDQNWVSIGIDGATPEDTFGSGESNNATNDMQPASCRLTKSGLAEGYHYATILAHRQANGTLSFYGSATPGNRTVINYEIN